MTGWFGIRGIGSLYYLMYAIEHGLPEELSLRLIQLVLIVVTLSILCHGVSVKPLMAWFVRGKREAKTDSEIAQVAGERANHLRGPTL